MSIWKQRKSAINLHQGEYKYTKLLLKIGGHKMMIQSRWSQVVVTFCLWHPGNLWPYYHQIIIHLLDIKH